MTMIETLLVKCRLCGRNAKYTNRDAHTTAHKLAERDGWRYYGREAWECECRKGGSHEQRPVA